MKIKFSPAVFYPGLVLVLVLAIILLTSFNDKKTDSNKEFDHSTMPDDEIHRNFKHPDMGSPSKGNVMEGVKKQMETLKKEVEQNPSDTAKVREYADLLAAGHYQEEALMYYNHIIKLDPKRVDLLFAITFLHYSQGNIDKAEETTNLILSKEKGNLLAQYNLGAIEAARGNNEKAIKIWEELIKQNPNTEAAEIAKTSIKSLSSPTN
ncbi:MAG: tetratricopeptide repeat protein [Ignavibacterium sp.]|nr:tetratricopeptide repeat protein [Ignavibacterium sp.]